ncbi:TetR family transcriptional regulator [Saccharomonospora sp. CUA-673]|uniref:TetR/AcrR family transcriptional regulator n=1 Tax=Saccharomonospora sp. CUA-673 TaxID=1904969 RepID=UPI0009669888|nr:TetR/AcrR family transcriptional regulator [Saccharomonospora sp. CUA-673]OLT45450.1 TetR family transcriptional regulator [Saccharomonospora sp. CUA-673]
MPKYVDHEGRRTEIVEATWRLIAERGIEEATMRAISESLDMANGALKYYFPDKNSIIRAAFEHVVAATNARVRERVGEATGLAALRAFCVEMAPLTELTKLEARVVLPFWQRALSDPDLERLHTDSVTLLRAHIVEFLQQARAEGTVRASTPDDVLADQLLAMLIGLQALALLDQDGTGEAAQLRMIDAFLDSLA